MCVRSARRTGGETGRGCYVERKPLDVHTEHFANNSYLKAEVVLAGGDGI